MTHPSTEDFSGIGPGTMILTTEGEMPIEWLAPGDKLITRDHGAQPILHIARTRELPWGGAVPMPFLLRPGEQGPQGEAMDKLRVAPGHRGLLQRPEVELNFGTDEALARFADVSRRTSGRPDPSMGNLQYHHIIMERHEIISAGSFWIETADADMAKWLDVPAAVRRKSELFSDRPQTARTCLSRPEAQLVRGEVPQDLTILDLMAA